MTSFPISNHKTVIILDRCLYFNESSKHQVDFDVFMKTKTPTGGNPIAPVTKSLWTCNVEAALEYARIVYDLFPDNKLLYFIVNDLQASQLNNWSHSTQNLNHISSNLASKAMEFLASSKQRANQSATDDSISLLNALSLALKALCEPTPSQQKEIAEHGKVDRENTGRIVCISSFKSNEIVHKLETSFQEALTAQNRLVSGSNSSLPIGRCHLSLIDVVPLAQSNKCTKIQTRNLSQNLSSELHCCCSGIEVPSKLVELAIDHYQLALTTVMGIPMKEEQNALSSANYDVELLHCKDALDELFNSGDLESCLAKSKEIIDAHTIQLKWVTPKISVTGLELPQCYAAHRVTPVDVNSRPSLCLTNFLLGGRSVMLEHSTKTGPKQLSHMLTSHAGEIFIHSLVTFRSILEDPPSIIEGPGGRLTDYRIQDFGELMKASRLAPMSCTDTGEPPLERAKRQLERMTRHWPLIISDTIIFNMTSAIEPLPSLLTRETLTEMEVVECLKVIYQVVAMETENKPLLAASTGSRAVKSLKREEQYKQMWLELEKLIHLHSSTSTNHMRVLTCFLDYKGQDVKAAKEGTAVLEVQKKVTDEKHEPTKRELEGGDSNAPKKFKGIMTNLKTGCSLLSLWEDHLKEQYKPTKKEFYGLSASVNNKFELYQQLKENQNAEEGEDSKME